MPNYYYSGQGTFYIASRSVGGLPTGFISVGNVSKASIEISVDKFEHKESESGQRLLDLTIVKEKKGKLSLTIENLSMDNLALALYGSYATKTGTTVTSENLVGYLGKMTPLAYPSVSGVTITNAAGNVTYSSSTDYLLDMTNGTITIPASGSTITDAQALKANYTYATHKQMDAFTSGSAPERWVRFQGLNTADGSKVQLDIFRARFDPMTGYELINDELSVPTISADLLADSTKTSGSQFFIQKNL